ncbi:unnamed protein product, partial [Arabidopsis halleri]
VATPYKHFPKYFPVGISGFSAPLRGSVFLQWGRKARVICNPVTGKSITLPKVKATGVKKSYFGFDPISKQFKVLCMTWSRYGTPNTHRILTLETGKRLWRTIQDPVLPHYSMGDGICINGVLYYEASFKESRSYKIVCFDFTFEKFSFIKLDKDMVRGQKLTLFNYKGKLGANQDIGLWCTGNFALWVLEDAGKHKWSKLLCVLPPLWDNIVNTHMMVGMTVTGEIVYSPYAGYLSNPFDIFYYNIER